MNRPLSICLIGPLSSGKTTLLSALSHFYSDSQQRPLTKRTVLDVVTRDRTPFLLDWLPEEFERGMTIHPGMPYPFVSAGRTYLFYDTPGHPRYQRTAARTIKLCDVAILVVSPTTTRSALLRYLHLARIMDIRQFAVVGNLVQRGSRPLQMGWWQRIQESTIDYWEEMFPTEAFPVFMEGDILRMCQETPLTSNDEDGRFVFHLARALSNFLPKAVQNSGAARLAVYRRFYLPGQGTAVVGRLNGGVIRKGDTLEIEAHHNGYWGLSRYPVHSLQMQRQPVEEAKPGDFVSILFGDPILPTIRTQTWVTSEFAREKDDWVRGVLARVRLFSLEASDGGEPDLLYHGQTVAVSTGWSYVGTSLHFCETTEPLFPGESIKARLSFAFSLPVSVGQKLLLFAEQICVGEVDVLEQVEWEQAKWTCYQRRTDEALLSLRSILSRPTPAACWKGLVAFFGELGMGHPEHEQDKEFRQVISQYALEHIRSWTRTTGSDEDELTGLWRLDAPANQRGSWGPGFFLFVLPSKSGILFRDVFLRYPLSWPVDWFVDHLFPGFVGDEAWYFGHRIEWLEDDGRKIEVRWSTSRRNCYYHSFRRVDGKLVRTQRQSAHPGSRTWCATYTKWASFCP